MKVRSVEVLDINGAAVKTGGGDLSLRQLRFTVDGADQGDVVRVEVLTDPTFGPPKEVAQIIAGTFEGHGPQTMTCRLKGFARHDYDISIYCVDSSTAQRDINADVRLAWRTTITVA